MEQVSLKRFLVLHGLPLIRFLAIVACIQDKYFGSSIGVFDLKQRNLQNQIKIQGILQLFSLFIRRVIFNEVYHPLPKTQIPFQMIMFNIFQLYHNYTCFITYKLIYILIIIFFLNRLLYYTFPVINEKMVKIMAADESELLKTGLVGVLWGSRETSV